MSNYSAFHIRDARSPSLKYSPVDFEVDELDDLELLELLEISELLAL